ncbi:hypothetical protein VR46_42330, partial [Streptomyces sp. NRRL S-444]
MSRSWALQLTSRAELCGSRPKRTVPAVATEADGAGLMSRCADGHALVQVDAVRQQMVLVHAQVAEHALQFVPQPLQTCDVVLLVEGEVDPAVPVEGDAVVRVR